MKKVIALLLMICTAFAVFSQAPADSVTVYFRVGYSNYDPALDQNAVVMDRFISRLLSSRDSIDHIVVKGYASPDGVFKVNKKLAESRCSNIVAYIIGRTGLNPDLFEADPQGIAWGELRHFVEENPDVPSRAAVLDVLDNVPVWVYDDRGRVIDGRKKRLMEIDGGRPYRWMLENLFPQLRKSVAVSAFLKTPEKPEEIHPAVEPADTIPSIATIIAEAEGAQTDLSDRSDLPDLSEPSEVKPRHRFALKTNLIFDAALTPNLEFEWLIKDNWSVALEGDMAWWGNSSKNQAYQLIMLSPEARYWIHPREPWHGMFAGVFAGGGYYDFQNGNGVQGEGVMTGLSFGYMFPIARNFSLEASIGAGYLFTRYKEYEPRDGHYLYQRTKDLHYFGPLKLKLSFVWRFSDANKIKRIKSAI